MASTTWHSQFVFPGACVSGSNSNVNKCALERAACTASGSTFLSARQLLEGSNPRAKDLCLPNENGSSTAANKHIMEAVQVGRCSGPGDSNICTGSADACLQRNSFVLQDPACRLDDDKTQGSPIFNTVFGQCTDSSGNNGVCMWDDTDCNTNFDGSSWLHAAQARNDPRVNKCGCEDVNTGACLYQNNYYCAVSSNACDSASTFVKASDLPSTVTCALCTGGFRRTSKTSPFVSTLNAITDAAESLSPGAIASIVIGTIAVLTLLLFAFTRLCRGGCRRGSNKVSEGAVDKSLEDLEMDVESEPETAMEVAGQSSAEDPADRDLPPIA